MRVARLSWFEGARRFSMPVLLLVLVMLGALLPTYWVYLLSAVAVGSLIARSIGLITNQVGLITLCQMSFAAIGGWVVSWLALCLPEAPFPLLVLIGGVAVAPVGLLIGLATARIRGIELAVVTLGFAAALDLVLRQGSFPGVGEGTPVIPAAPFDDPRWFFALAWGLLILLQLGLAAIGRTAHGLGWAAVRSSERAAAALGVRVGLAKASAFGIGALFAGGAGGLLAGQYGLLTSAAFSPLNSLVQLATAVLCGAGLFSGAVLAGAFGVFVPEVLRRVGLPLDVANALLALGAFDVLRRGNGGIMEQLNAKIQDRSFRGTRVTCELAPSAALQANSSPVTSRENAPEVPRLELSNLTVAYGVDRVLDGVDLTLRPGEIHALIGPNGAGKSTLIDVVSGFLPGHSGTAHVDGIQIDGLSAHSRAQRGVRRIFQQLRVMEALTVDEYLRLASGNSGAAKTAEVREFFGLPDGDVPIRLMDVGSRRILEIAGALASKPRVLLLDEPAAGLAETESVALAQRLRRIPKEFGVPVLLIEHDMAVVREAASRVTVLDEGKVIASGPTAEVLEDARVVAAYLGKEVAR